MKGSENNSPKAPSSSPAEKFTTSLDASAEWSPERIRHSLELKGYTLASLSREHGMHESACRKALRKPWPKVERIIAECVGVDCPSELFPDRYSSDGFPLKYSKHLGNTSSKRTARSSEKIVAAPFPEQERLQNED